MGKILESKQFMNDNIFNYEKRLESQYTIFLEKQPTFVTYYHISNASSITDTGLLNVERIIGDNSPVVFQKIEDFPIYGIDNIKLDLSEEDMGLVSTFEGEGIILPNTIKPLPNDLFKISYLDQNYLFMVNNINYDTIKSNNFYNISFSIKTLNPGESTQLDTQVQDVYNCIFANIGTDDKCLIKSDEYEKLAKLEDVYEKIAEKYLSLYYNKKFNSLLYCLPHNDFLYDKYMTKFIMDNKLFNKCDRYDTIYLSNEDNSNSFEIEYDFSVFPAIVDKNIVELKHYRFLPALIGDKQSIFKFYSAKYVKSVLLVDTGTDMYMDDKLIDCIKINHIDECMDILDKIIIKYFNDGIDSIYNIGMEELEAYRFRYTLREFTLIPIVLYIVLQYANKFIKNANEDSAYSLV